MQENINIPDSTITTNLSFRQLVLMNMQQLTNFPYIEKDFDALTDYELLCLVVKYLNDVIANQNEQNDSITRVYNSFLALQTYVNNTKDSLEDAFNNLDNYVRYYFDNLDVQEEINNKLDDMLEDGTLSNIIDTYLTAAKNELEAIVDALEVDVNQLEDSYNLLLNDKDFLIDKKIIAHRGCDNIAPENTIPAFEYVAKVGGYYGCETDVRRTYDGKFIIMHDESVDRTTDGTGNVSDLLWSTIQNLTIDTGAFIEEYPNLKVPTLKEYLYCMKKYGLLAIIEIKDEWSSEILQELLTEIKTCGMLENCILQSFNRNVCTRLKALNQSLNIYILYESAWDSEIESFVINNKLNLSINGTFITEQIVETMHANNLKVLRWIDFNDDTSADFLMCADITRCNYKNKFYKSIAISEWNEEEINKYGDAFNGRLSTFIRRGHTNEGNEFPGYFQSANSYSMVCLNTIQSDPDKLFNYNVPVGYDMQIYKFQTPSNAVPGLINWITGDGQNASNINVTYLFTGIIVLVFRRTDSAILTYRDIEYLRNNAHVWFTNKS